jgi:hypothetical protein
MHKDIVVLIFITKCLKLSVSLQHLWRNICTVLLLPVDMKWTVISPDLYFKLFPYDKAPVGCGNQKCSE